jgi:hypothetical protein
LQPSILDEKRYHDAPVVEVFGPEQRLAIERWFVEVVRRALRGGDRDRS